MTAPFAECPSNKMYHRLWREYPPGQAPSARSKR